jgi:1-acyl-sn-glycerol-3-phosphate acyltransferase
MDGAMLKVGIINEHPAKRELRFLVDDFVFHFPFLGTLMNRIGGVRACPENAERLLASGEIVSVFPEGIKGIGKLWKDRYRLERFGRGGVIRLAMKTRSPITPVAVIGGEEIYPLLYKSHILARPLGLPFIPITPLFPLLGPLGAIPLPTKWTISFGKPISFDQFGVQDLNDGILINRETENLRQVIQKMIRDGLEKRRSVFEG